MSRVFVGMSGGVDSSLAAALLVEQGYEVTGVFMKNWTDDVAGLRCPWAEDLADAKRVAVRLGIPFEVFDFQTDYKQLVVDYMIQQYRAGRTPNPDIMCNQEVKFGLFKKVALSKGADLIATGHYARSKNNNLLMARNLDKDQTYFLYRIDGDAVSKTIFPIGDFVSKKDVRQQAEQRGLITAHKRDSQGICFVGSVSIKDFLAQYVEVSPGDIVERDSGKVVGRHEGALFYTLGQRHGLKLGGGLPYYVVAKDMAKNIVYVSTNLNDGSFWRKEIVLSDLHWINKNQLPLDNHQYQIRVRHRADLRPTTLGFKENGTELVVKPDNPERAVASGQSIVIYDGETVLGGGIVK